MRGVLIRYLTTASVYLSPLLSGGGEPGNETKASV